MEKKLIEEWLKSNNGAGYGYGYGIGYGYYDGAGYSYDNIYSRSGYGYDDGSGDGSGSSEGHGSRYGYGYGDGIGVICDNGDITSLKKYNQDYIFVVDNISTIIKHIKGNIAKGYIVNSDLTLKTTYIAKGYNLFAHGETIKEANESLQSKIFATLDIESRIEEFKKLFKKGKKYKGTEYFKWHNLLTGSCLQGRKHFVNENNLDLEKEYSVLEFLKIIKNTYGWNVLKDLEKDYKENKK